MKLYNKLKNRAVKLKRDITALYFAYLDKKTPVLAKVLTIITVAYAVSPIDLIPDFIPVLGYLDDLIILPLLIILCLKLIPVDVMERSRIKAEQHEGIGSKYGRIAAALIILFWLCILVFLLIRIFI